MGGTLPGFKQHLISVDHRAALELLALEQQRQTPPLLPAIFRPSSLHCVPSVSQPEDCRLDSCCLGKPPERVPTSRGMMGREVLCFLVVTYVSSMSLLKF